MSANLHIANAEYIDRAPELRLIDATLAAAYEQRTANLIALEALLQAAGSDIEVDAIQERLGLG